MNQEATDKMIKALIDEKERLLKELENAKTGKGGVSQEGNEESMFTLLYVQINTYLLNVAISRYVRLYVLIANGLIYFYCRN